MISYDSAKEVKESLRDLLRYDKTVVMLGIENRGGEFGVLIGSTHPKGVEVPDELDNVSIRVIEMQPPSAYEPRD